MASLNGYNYHPEKLDYMRVDLVFRNSSLRERGVTWLKAYGAAGIALLGETTVSAILEDTIEMSRDLLRLPGVQSIEKCLVS